MKKIRIIALSLVLVVCGAFCLSACGDKKDTTPVATVEDVKGHYGEIAEISLASQKVYPKAEGYALRKEHEVLLVEQSVNDYVGAVLESFTNEIIAVSKIKNSYVSDYLKAVRDFVIAYNGVQQTASELLDKYQAKILQLEGLGDLSSEQIQLKEGYSSISAVCEDISKNCTVEYDGMLSVCLLILKAPFDAINVKELLGGQAELAALKNKLEAKDYEDITQAIESAYLAGKKIVEIFDFSAYVNVLINLILNQSVTQQVYNSIVENINPEYAEFFNGQLETIQQVEQTLKDELKLDKEDKKQAYVTLISTVLSNSYKYPARGLYGINFDSYVEFAEANAVKDVDKTATAFRKMINQAGKGLYGAALSQSKVKELISVSQTLDKYGLGHYVEKYLSVYAYLQELVGQTLKIAEKDDLEVLAKIMLIDDELYSQNSSQLRILTLTVSAKTVINGYERWKHSDELEKSWTKAVGEDFTTLLTSTVKSLTNMSKECPSNCLDAFNQIVSGTEYFNKDQRDTVILNGGIIVGLLRYNDFIVEDMKDGYNELLGYVDPLIDLLASFIGEEKAEEIKESIPSSDLLYDIMDEFLGDLT